jgi:23S rRNA (cytidine1920-2'-O)/16S rRNA (cytidine1409-2'-O)-methyltransferase
VAKERLDILMVAHGLAESRAQAQRLVMAGEVRVSGQVVLKPATAVPDDAAITIDQRPAYVSRGGEKLEAALKAFEIPIQGFLCADVGASTGGFTDCLLQHGARQVYAIDVGHGILAWKLRQDPRVVVMEETNARFVENLPQPVDLVTIDASFISLKILLPVVKGWLPVEVSEPGWVIALIKPQFEAGKALVGRGKGVIRDPQVHRQIVSDVLAFAQSIGYGLMGLIRSPILGPKGNVEFLACFSPSNLTGPTVQELLQACFVQEQTESAQISLTVQEQSAQQEEQDE